IRMPRSAIFSTKDDRLPGIGRIKPKFGTPAGHYILFYPIVGNKKGVNDILRIHDKLNRPIGRNMQVATGAGTIFISKLPHPLLRGYFHFVSIIGDGFLLHKDLISPAKNDEYKD